MMKGKQKIQGNSSQVQHKNGFFVLIAIAALGYLYYLTFHFHLTESTIISAIIAVVILFTASAFVYYLAYRRVFPSLQTTRAHVWFAWIITSLQIGMGISVWFVQNKEFPARLLSKLNALFPSVLDGKPIHLYSNYFPLINFLLFTFLTALSILILLLIGNQLLKLPLLQKSNKLLLIGYTLLLVSVTTCVYSTDFLEIGVGQQSIIFYGGTEDYVNYRIMNEELSFQEDLRQFGGFLYGYNYHKELVVYSSSTGFYGTLLKLGQSVTKIPPDDVLKGSRVLFSLVTAVMLSSISLKIKKHIGLMASVVFSLFCLITYWLLGPASHLIWFFPVLLIPLILSIFLYPFVKEKSLPFSRFLVFSLIGYVFVLLRGYTYAPVMVLSGAIPVFFYEVNRKETIKTLLWRCIQVCLIGVLGYSIVLVIHSIQLGLYFGSMKDGVQLIIEKAVFRGADGDTNLQTPLDIFQQWMTVRVFYVSKRFFAVFPQWQESFDQVNTFKNLHLMTFGAVIYSLLLSLVSKLRSSAYWLTEKQRNLMFSLSMTTLAAMVSSWTWFPALGHMSHHYHMNGIMYIIPFGLSAFMLFGVLVEYSIQLILTPHK